MANVDDADDRRLTIARAVWRLAAHGGLEEVTMRKVAAEAGLSTRLVQYYFGTRQSLLREALSMRREHDRTRLAGVLRAGGTARQRLRATLLALLPIDADGRESYLINVAFFVRSLGAPDLVQLFADDDRALVEFLAGQIEDAVAADELDAATDSAAEAALLIALYDGMSSRLLLGMWTATDASAMIDRHLHRLFEGGPAQGRAPSSSR